MVIRNSFTMRPTVNSVVLLFWFFSISGKATQFLKNWGPFSYGTCDFGKLTEWRGLGGKVVCVVFAGMMLASVSYTHLDGDAVQGI